MPLGSRGEVTVENYAGVTNVVADVEGFPTAEGTGRFRPKADRMSHHPSAMIGA